MFRFWHTQRAKDPIVIACASDETYAIGLAVMVRSLLEQNKKRSIIIYILNGGITAETKQKLLDSWTIGHATFHFITPDPKNISHLTGEGGRNIAEYFRLLIPTILPYHYTKVLYLDIDTVIHHDISDLWDINLEDAPLAAAQDFGVPFVSSEPWGLANYKELNITPDEPYFSAGIMLMNLPVWRSEHIAEQVIDYTEKHHATVKLWEQDGLNVILHGRWKHLDIRWNVVLGALKTFEWWKPTEWQQSMQSLVEKDPWITHFAAIKPWIQSCKNPEKHRFFAVLDRTMWKGWRP